MGFCKQLYLKKMTRIYIDKKHECLGGFGGTKEAKAYAIELTGQAAKEHGFWKFSDSGEKKGAPVSFISPNNKIKEEEGEWKQRVLFSYYSHPLRRYGRRVGRCLTLLLKEAKKYIPSTGILSTQCTMVFIRRWNKWLKEVGSTNPLELWELGVKEMFPSLHREDIFQNLQDFALRVQKERKKKERKKERGQNSHPLLLTNSTVNSVVWGRGMKSTFIILLCKKSLRSARLIHLPRIYFM